MTIRTTNLAFRNFTQNTIPSCGSRHEVTDITVFGTADMVKFQHARIAFTAINALVQS